MSEQIKEGWYQDPTEPNQWRWWDGQAWTDQVYEGTTEPEPTEAAGISYDDESGYNDEIGSQESGGARAVFFIIVIIAVIGMILIAIAA